MNLSDRLAKWEAGCRHVSNPLADDDWRSEFVLATCMRCGNFAVLVKSGVR